MPGYIQNRRKPSYTKAQKRAYAAKQKQRMEIRMRRALARHVSGYAGNGKYKSGPRMRNGQYAPRSSHPGFVTYPNYTFK